MKKQTAYRRALSAWNSFGILPIMMAIVWGVFMALIGFGVIPITLATPAGMVPNPAFEGLAVLLSTLFVYTVLYVGACGMRLTMLQMEQAEEHQRSTEHTLADALSEVRKELRRRPDASPPVTFSLFGRPNAAGTRTVPVQRGDTVGE
jgi:hypothetical protein